MIHIDPIAAIMTNIQYPNNPFHIGEITLQRLEHVHDHVMSYAPQVIRSHYMPDQHRLFYTDLPFVVAAIRDPITGYMWSTLLENNINHHNNNNNNNNNNNAETTTSSVHVATSPDPNTLHIYGRPVIGDALEHVFDPPASSLSSISSSQSSPQEPIDVGLLGIQFETARRNRVNGRITIIPPTTTTTSTMDPTTTTTTTTIHPMEQSPLIFKVSQSFGNCPQYIKPRKQWVQVVTSPTTTNLVTTVQQPPTTTTTTTSSSATLSPSQIQWIQQAETFFTATGYRDLLDQNHQEDVRYGNDASHRGGPPGFVQVVTTSSSSSSTIDSRIQDDQQQQQQEIVWTEFSGNNHFNSLGNLIVDSRIGLCFPNFKTGGMLQITGTAMVEMGNLQLGQRQVRMSILAINEVPSGSLPIRWPSIDKSSDEDNDDDDDDDTWSTVQVTKIVQESDNVKSLYFQQLQTQKSSVQQSLPEFRSGQHLPIQLNNGLEVLDRRYSISSSPSKSDDYYRISVKRHEHGKSSSHLHSHIKVGDTIKVGHPGGDFVLPNDRSQYNSIVFISAGIGITPLLSMLYELATSSKQMDQEPIIYWIHGAKNSNEHPFQNEIQEIQQMFSTKQQLPPNVPMLHVHTLYSAPKTNDVCHNKVGRITVPYIQELVPNLLENKTLLYICGPLAFQADMTSGLENIGVNNKNIMYETF